MMPDTSDLVLDPSALSSMKDLALAQIAVRMTNKGNDPHVQEEFYMGRLVTHHSAENYG